MVQASQLKLAVIVTKTTVVHTVTYFVAGALAYAFFDYQSLWDEPVFNIYMRRMDDPVLMAGPLFQPIRGVLFGVVFYLSAPSSVAAASKPWPRRLPFRLSCSAGCASPKSGG